MKWYVNTSQSIKTIDFRDMWRGYKYLVIIEHNSSHSVTTLTNDGFLNIKLPKMLSFIADKKGHTKYIRSYKHMFNDGSWAWRVRWVLNKRHEEKQKDIQTGIVPRQ